MAEGVSRETQMSLAASSMFPGFRFSPTDVELISYYLKKKLEGTDECVEVISEVEICKYEPWDLPAKSIIQSENEWFFFCARGRKYPNGSQSKRATELGYWKATGKERNVKSGSNVIGTKRTLVFHIGRAPNGERTEWIMHEYCLDGKSQDSLVICRLKRNIEFCPNNNSNRTQNRRQSSTMHDSNLAASEGGAEQTGISEGDKGVESNSKKCSSSYDSHSVVQNDSTSEFTLTESCCQQKDFDDEDDFFAEILNDDIISLDETSSLTSKPDLLQPVIPGQWRSQEMPSHVFPFQGTAHRRLKLMKRGKSGLDEYYMKETRSPKTQASPNCLRSMFSAKTVNFRVISLTFITLTLLALFLSLLGCSRGVKNFQYTSFHKDI
ncbi:hypothetical protein SLEP1_g7348 [Rubroshorea leprosula]|uniref:NAC domain-containing protein n=1 Tax=Rubroshorea leprosula TaxID=152421 RepID=A0AAV5I7C3_9ROSI|nr:hypothetical protein SLEP1_g7348 [Rubroshorea leprosula]